MLAEIIKLIIRFLLLIGVQVILLNNIRFAGFINPYIYVLFILLLPVKIPRTLLLIVAFALGLCIDVFSNTMGMHAAATVFLAFLRPGILRMLAPRDGYEAEAIPSLKEFGFSWFLVYAMITVLAHHMFLFFAEVFLWTEFFSTMWRAFASSLFSVLLIFITLFLFDKSKEQR
jgi:rod shape-determining protein MreD